MLSLSFLHWCTYKVSPSAQGCCKQERTLRHTQLGELLAVSCRMWAESSEASDPRGEELPLMSSAFAEDAPASCAQPQWRLATHNTDTRKADGHCCISTNHVFFPFPFPFQSLDRNRRFSSLTLSQTILSITGHIKRGYICAALCLSWQVLTAHLVSTNNLIVLRENCIKRFRSIWPKKRLKWLFFHFWKVIYLN